MWQNCHLAQIHLILGPLLNTSASHTQWMEGVYGRKKSLTDFRSLKFYLSFGCWVSGSSSLHIRRNRGRRRKQNKTELFFSFHVKEVSISYGRKKMFSSLEKYQEHSLRRVYLRMLTLFFMSDLTVFTSNFIYWHRFASGCTLSWEAWKVSISNSLFENEMPGLLLIMPCQQMGPHGGFIMESKIVTPKETSTSQMIHSNRMLISQCTLLSTISTIWDFYSFKTKASGVDYCEALMFQELNNHGKDILLKITMSYYMNRKIFII